MKGIVLACGGIALMLATSSGCCSRCCGYGGGSGGMPQGAYAAPMGTQSAMVTMPTTTAAYPTYAAPVTTTALAPLESLPTY